MDDMGQLRPSPGSGNVEVTSDPLSAKPRRTMQECIPLFLQALQANNRSRRTIDGYRSKVQQFVAWLDGRKPTRQELYAYRIYRQEQGKRPRTIRVDLTAVYAFFEWLEKDG